jgi:hypothetical protein
MRAKWRIPSEKKDNLAVKAMRSNWLPLDNLNGELTIPLSSRNLANLGVPAHAVEVIVHEIPIALSRSITNTTTCFGANRSVRRGAISIVEPKPVITRTVNPKKTSKPIKR